MGGVVLLSGGLDSTVAAAHAVRHGGLDLALTVDYGQRAAARERGASRRIAASLGIAHEIVTIDFLRDLGGSVLFAAGAPFPDRSAGNLDDGAAARRDARDLWVPNRNGLFVNIAACFAEARGAERVVVGFNAEEAASFPDNSEPFLEAATRALGFSTLKGVRVESPAASCDKAGLVRMGLELGAPLGLIWSCYGGGERHCWRCTSCLRLKRALLDNGVFDDFEL